MNLEDYFDFLGPDDIRIRGTRVGIETILYDYVHRKLTPEEIVERYPVLRLDQVYASVLYYLRNQVAMDAYLAEWLEWGHQMRARQRQERPPFVDEVLAIREGRSIYSADSE